MAIQIGSNAKGWEEIDSLLIHPQYPMSFWHIIPLGCLSLAQYLDSRGYRVVLWDCALDPQATDDALKSLLKCTKVRFAGLSFLSSQLNDAQRLARLIKEISPGTCIVAGGNHISGQPDDSFPEADFLVVGEGELCLERLLSGHQFPSRLINGEPLSDINVVPLPDQAIFERYMEFQALSRVGLMVSRGCPFDCAFCLSPVQRSRRQRRYAPERVGELLTAAYAATGLDDFFFLDDIFTLNRDWVMDLCAEIHRRGLSRLRYHCFSHVKVGNREIYRALAQAGFLQIQLGLESGDPAILKRMRKNFSLEEARQTVKLIKECGMEANCLFILGYAGDTLDTMRLTLEFAESLETPLWFSLAQPFPGSQFYEEAQHEGTIIESDFSKYENTRIVYLPAGVTREEMHRIQTQAEELRLKQDVKYRIAH